MVVRWLCLWIATGCWTGTVEPLGPPSPLPAPAAKVVLGRDLIIKGQAWRYEWHETMIERGKQTDEDGELHCTVTEVVPWAGGRAGNLACDGNLSDSEWQPDFDPFGGPWAMSGINDGLWRLSRMPHNDDFVMYTQFIVAEEQSEPIEGIFKGREVGTIPTYRRGSQWCRREERDDIYWLYELCFDRSGITSGQLRHEERDFQRKVSFERQ